MLYEFYGADCPHCIEMKPLINQLIKEEGIEIEVLEVWENEENAKLKDKYDTGACGGVPFFVNTDSGETICGSTDYETLIKWAGK